MTATRDRRPVPDRARKRAIRALAAELGVAYSVAARLLAAPAPAPTRHSQPGFPTGGDEHRAWMFHARANRTFHARVHDTRLATELPTGRAEHLVRRFPPLRAIDTAGPLYAGEHRQSLIAMLYAVLVHESPELLPRPDELTWAADLGEESAVDVPCADLDRAARRLLDGERWRLWPRIDAALTAGEDARDRRVRDAAITLGQELRSTSLRGSVDGARHILDALLAGPHGARPPGTRVCLDGRDGTVVGAEWTAGGPPTGYLVRFDDDSAAQAVPSQEFDLDRGTTAEPDLIPG